MKSHKLIKNPKISGKCVLVLLILIFCLTMTTFVMNESEDFRSNSNNTILRILLRPAASSENSAKTSQLNSTRFLLINVKSNKIHSNDRVTRHIQNLTGKTQKGYYEEQQPVIVHAESALPLMDLSDVKNSVGKMNAPEQTENERPDYVYDNDEDYYNFQRNGGYERNGNSAEYEEYSEGRSTQNQQYDSNQWNYGAWSNRNSGKTNIQSAKERPSQTPKPQSSYPSYSHDEMEYDYPMGFVHRHQLNEPKIPYNPDVYMQQKQQSLPRIPDRQQMIKTPQQRPTQNTNESTLLSVAKGLKTMWDIYQAFSTAWNTIAEHRQRQDDALKEKLKQQQRKRIRMRINSKKPPKFNSATTVIDDNELNNDNKSTTNGKNNTKIRSTKSPKLKTTTKTTTKLPASTTSSTPKSTSAKVEPRRATKGDRALKLDAFGLRERQKRGTDGNDDAGATSVSEGRYIKGDPLKGYYDFVITEGSYKFWAIFQTGTAILIIYSVFAAIYYSKVNPLVSDYDYTDYLGGARSLSSGGDLDFVDDEDDHKEKSSTNWYSDIMPNAGHSIKFILDAIDKFPVDHDTNVENQEDLSSLDYTTTPYS